MRAVYCKCTNTYSIKCEENRINNKCNAFYYWQQGIGNIYRVLEPLTDANFQEAIEGVLKLDPIRGQYEFRPYGAIKEWDVSAVTTMVNTFKDNSQFNQDLSNWNVENVTDSTGFSENTPQWNLPKPNFN
jgi:surface protein